MSVETFASSHSELASPTPRRLWFGLVASALAWLTLGAVDLLVVWNQCAHQQQYSGEGSYTACRILLSAVSIVLLLVAIAGGITSYNSWRKLSRQHLLETIATDRREFMALLGVIISITLGVGIVWLSIPPLLIQLCERAK